MTKVNVIDLKGEKVKDLTINDEIWKNEGNDIVLKKAIRLQLDSLRQGTADTKGRSEEENHTDKKELVMLDKDLFVHHTIEAVESYLVQLLEVTHSKLIEKKED